MKYTVLLLGVLAACASGVCAWNGSHVPLQPPLPDNAFIHSRRSFQIDRPGYSFSYGYQPTLAPRSDSENGLDGLLYIPSRSVRCRRGATEFEWRQYGYGPINGGD